MGDRSGNIRWWDVTTGQSSSFNTHRDGIRRIKFSPVVPGDRSRGRIAVLFYDNTFSVFDLVSENNEVVGSFSVIVCLLCINDIDNFTFNIYFLAFGFYLISLQSAGIKSVIISCIKNMGHISICCFMHIRLGSLV